MITRTETLRAACAWAQPDMAADLGVTQPTVCRLEGGQTEPGPVSRLLDLLEQRIAAGDIPPSPRDSAASSSPESVRSGAPTP